MNEMRDMMSRDHSGITMKDMMKLNPQQSKYKNNKPRMRICFVCSHTLVNVTCQMDVNQIFIIFKKRNDPQFIKYRNRG